MHATPRFLAAATLAALLVAPVFACAGGSATDPLCGDINQSNTITTGDALGVLKAAVGPFHLGCAPCAAFGFYGNAVELPASSNNSPDFLLGSSIKITDSATVTHLGVIMKAGGPHVQMALYTDNAGNPDQLVVATAQATLAAGVQELPVPPTPVNAGTYWIMAVYDGVAHVAVDTSDSNAPYKFGTLAFGSAPPSTFGASTLETGFAFSYYAKAIR